jgi:hypothetical protein
MCADPRPSLDGVGDKEGTEPKPSSDGIETEAGCSW